MKKENAHVLNAAPRSPSVYAASALLPSAIMSSILNIEDVNSGMFFHDKNRRSGIKIAMKSGKNNAAGDALTPMSIPKHASCTNVNACTRLIGTLLT